MTEETIAAIVTIVICWIFSSILLIWCFELWRK